MSGPLFRKIDAYLIKAADLDGAVAFYRDRLGHAIVWRTPEAVALHLPDTDAELVVHAQLEPEVDFIVHDVERAFADLIAAGAKPLMEPFDIAIGRRAKVEDPFGNRLTILDQTKGKLATDAEHNVVGVVKR